MTEIRCIVQNKDEILSDIVFVDSRLYFNTKRIIKENYNRYWEDFKIRSASKDFAYFLKTVYFDRIPLTAIRYMLINM